MGQSRSRRKRIAAATAALVVTAGLSGTGQATAEPSEPSSPITSERSLDGALHRSATKPKALLPKKGTHAFLVKLTTRSTQQAFMSNLDDGRRAAKTAARGQLSVVRASQDRVISELPESTRVLYRAHSVLNAVAVRTDARNLDSIHRISGVAAIYPIASKTASNSYAVPLQGGAAAWTAFGTTGANTSIAIIDTGLDHTHANFGGPGTEAAYDTAHAAETAPADPSLFPSAKIVGGTDFAGDDYDAGADPADPDAPTPVPAPDPNPLDCNGHGSHVGGTAAGYGVNDDGSTYTGDYDDTTPFDSMKIGPGMAPQAGLYAYRVFGCDGSSDVVGAAIDAASDPNGDGDPSDHVDVINMSLGSDFGSHIDGDSIAANSASQLGIDVVVAAGNGGDLYDVGGSPGNATRTIAVANTMDAYSQLDALHVTAPAAAVGDYGAQRSIAYDWDSLSDLSGVVAQVTDPTNLEGCKPLSTADVAAVDGKVAWLEWSNTEGAIVCRSDTRSTNLENAGAIGFIFASDENSFSAGIIGSTTIPGVMITKAAGDELRPQLGSGVTVNGTEVGTLRQIAPADNDKVNAGSSRSSRHEGGVKPDVGAVGTTVLSTAVGTGTEGMSIGGTSMATPMVAGLTALVVQKHPEWTTEELKADIMNTAGQDLFAADNHTGDRFAPNRVGAGRIDAEAALSNRVLAYVADDPGAVSASFGPLEVTRDMTLTKTITVSNKSLDEVTYDVAYEGLTEIPGVEYTVSPSSVTLDPASQESVTLTLHIDRELLSKTIDPTMLSDYTSTGLPFTVPREFLADASGRVLLTSAGKPELRVPVYSAPRPASDMSAASSLTIPTDGSTAELPLSGTGVDQGSGAPSVFSIASAFELQAQSGLAPDCTDVVTDLCVHNEEERLADLRYVGTSSQFFSANHVADGYGYFAVSTHRPWDTPASEEEFDIYIDTNDDGVPDFVTFNTRWSADHDFMISSTFDLETFEEVDVQLINDRFGDLDTALYDSNTMVIPFSIAALGLTEGNSRIDYAVASFGNQAPAPVDVVGFDESFNVDGSLSFDPLHPGIRLGRTGEPPSILFEDQPGTTLPINRNATAYEADNGLGLMVVHFHNTNSEKVQIVSLKETPNVTLGLAPTTVQAGAQVTATVTVQNTAGVPTGGVTLKTTTGKTLGSGTLGGTGQAVITFKPSPAGSYSVIARYSGDATYAAGTSAPAALTVTKIKPKVVLKAPSEVKAGAKATATVTVKTVNGLIPTGKVVLKAGKKILGSAKLKAGKAKITFKIATKGSVKVYAKYAGNGNYKAGVSAKKTVHVV